MRQEGAGTLYGSGYRVTVNHMSAKARGWLTAAVAVALLAGLAVLGRVPAEPVTDAAPGGSFVVGRPAPPSTSGAHEQPSPLSPSHAVRKMLQRRATAILERDQAAFMSTVDPKAAPEFIAAQAALFANLDGVPLAEWSYEVDGAFVAAPPDRPGDDAPLWAPRTALRYALDGVDTVPTSRPLGYLYVERGGRWFLTADSALGPDSERTWRGPWDFGPCVTAAARSGLVVGHTGQERLVTSLAAELDGAVAAVTEVWGTEWSQRVAVLLPATIDEMREMVGPAFAVSGIAAAAVADQVDVANHTAVGQRVVLNPDQARRLSPSAMRIVLRHEITHVAARASTVDGAPMWLLEGFADYVGYRGSGLTPREAAPDLVRALRAGGLPGGLPEGLPTDDDFHGGNDNLDLAYQLAWSVALHVVDLAGEEELVRLYRLIAGGPTVDPSTVDGALRQVLGLDTPGFVASWRDSLIRLS
jgi:hypothetical protein